mmetsp:Transcript_25196/g.63225  ORF Transcript_25196/g.63225 Transcript_25196/m.63225 type:complete len:104 (-) Transcript_25196:1299-1610(-)
MVWNYKSKTRELSSSWGRFWNIKINKRRKGNNRKGKKKPYKFVQDKSRKGNNRKGKKKPYKFVQDKSGKGNSREGKKKPYKFVQDKSGRGGKKTYRIKRGSVN